MYRLFVIAAAALILLPLAGCATKPNALTPVENFNSDRYLGTWYEIARLDHSFERGMQNVTANYSLREDGKITVLNKGYKTKKGKWDTAKGKAYFPEGPETGYLKVSFFGPFYGDYKIFELDDDYQWAWIASEGYGYLWFLARDPNVSDELKQKFLARAKAEGFETSELIWVDHSPR